MKPFTLNERLRAGAVLAATQCEGGELESSWIYWWGLGYIRDHASPAVAAQHAQLWKSDAELLGKLGMQAVRLGVDWTRVEPQEEMFDEEALARYRAELSALREDGISVVLELHHFTSPAWFEDKGGFEREENLPLYLSYVERVAAALGDLAEGYLTFVEPNAYAVGGYLGGDYPPGRNNPSACYRVLTHMARCHVLAYERLHALHESLSLGACRVSVSLRAQAFSPRDEKSRAQRLLCRAAQRSFDAAFRAFYRGELRLPMKYDRYLSPGTHCDFLALDWYGRTNVSEPLDLTPFAPRSGVTDASALLDLLGRLHALAPMPISVTLAGVEDIARVSALAETLRALSGSGLPVERFYYAPLLDGFEWLDGQSRRLGLVQVDFETQSRSVKPAGEFYRRVLAARGADEALLAAYRHN